MIHLQDIHSLTDFARHTREYAKRLKKTGRPAVLTVNGRAEFVVQDAASYQKLLDIAARAEESLKLDQAFEDVEAGRLYGLETAEAALGIRAGSKKSERPS